MTRSASPPNRSKRAASSFAVAVVALVLPLASCAKDTARRGGRSPIVVAQAERRNVPYDVAATGTVEPLQSAGVSSNVGGLVTRVAFREGDEVRAGQALFQIDPRPFQADAERAGAVLARDRAQAQVARLDFERASALADRNVISTQELDQRRATADALAATVRADSAALSSARLSLGYSTVRAPISGRSGGRTVDVGDYVKAADPASPLVTIHQTRPILVRFTIAQDDLPELRRRMSGRVRVDVSPSDDDSTWIEGRLVFVDNEVDAGSGTVLVKAEFANGTGELWPGAFVRVRLRLYEEIDATVVPAVAVTEVQSGAFVYVVKADTTVEARPVRIARTWGTWAVVREGVTAGETVVVDGQLRLAPGAKATIKRPGAAAAAKTAEAVNR